MLGSHSSVLLQVKTSNSGLLLLTEVQIVANVSCVLKS